MSLLGANQEIKPKRRREIYNDVTELSQPVGSFYMMVALATVIAAYGLLINSAAVVVGAMLVAPLMGPIFGIALGLAAGDRRLLWASLRSEVIGIMIAVGVGVLIGLTPWRLPIGEEWMVRSQPTLYDLVIALASGLAGAYALIDDRISPALPGVAIAVAVLPPLAACGLALSAERWEMAGGAAMLFIANFLAIQIAAAVVFSAFGMLRVDRDERAPREDEDTAKIRQFLKRFWLSLLVLGVMAWFTTNALIGIAHERRSAVQVREVLQSAVTEIPGARLANTDIQRRSGHLRVTATILTPKAFRRERVAEIEAELRRRVEGDMRLVIRSVIAQDMSSEGAVFDEEEEPQPQTRETVLP